MNVRLKLVSLALIAALGAGAAGGVREAGLGRAGGPVQGREGL